MNTLLGVQIVAGAGARASECEYQKQDVPYNVKFSRHVDFALLMCAYFTTLKFRDFAKVLYFDSL